MAWYWLIDGARGWLIRVANVSGGLGGAERLPQKGNRGR